MVGICIAADHKGHVDARETVQVLAQQSDPHHRHRWSFVRSEPELSIILLSHRVHRERDLVATSGDGSLVGVLDGEVFNLAEMDFVSDSFERGGRFRTLTLIDVFTCECLALESDSSISGERVARVLSRVACERGLPDAIMVDNGTECTSKAMLKWSPDTEVTLEIIPVD